MLKALVLDMGGVIRDSREAMWLAIKKGFEENGLKFEFSAEEAWHLRGLEKYSSSRACIGALLAFSTDGNLREIFELADPEAFVDGIVALFPPDPAQIESIWKVYHHWFVEEPEAARLIKPCTGAVEGLQQLKKKYRLGIFSNMVHSTIGRDLEKFGLAGLFEVVLAADDVPPGSKKPNPGGILRACEMLGIAPADAGYVGDAVSDIVAAKAAGCFSIAVLTGMGLEKWLAKGRPDLIIKDLGELAGKM